MIYFESVPTNLLHCYISTKSKFDIIEVYYTGYVINMLITLSSCYKFDCGIINIIICMI